MKNVRIETPINKSPSIISYDSHALDALGDFLSEEICSWRTYGLFYYWLECGERWIGGNPYELNEIGEKIQICEQEILRIEENKDDPFEFITTRSQLRKIIKEWSELMSENKLTQVVIITQHDNGQVTLKAIYT